MDWGFALATCNASLNGIAFILLFLGWISIRSKKVERHKRFMVSAFIISILFLVSYLTRVWLTGIHRYPGTGILKTIYLGVLLTHTPLAATIPILAVRAIYLAFKKAI